MALDFHTLAQILLSRARELLVQWLPGGRFVGVEYTCSSLMGGLGNSCKINIKSGKWCDFSTDERGGDLISLYAAINRISQGDAYKQLADTNNFNPTNYSQPQIAAPTEPDPSSDVALTPPDDTPEPSSFNSALHGPASAHWVYKSPTGKPLFYISRHDPESSKKQILPWTWSKSKQRWANRGYPKPRPLYNLDLLTQNPTAPVVIVEGEKSCEAVAQLLPGYTPTTWCGGAQAIGQADFSPLFNREYVLIWPDNDKPGWRAALDIAAILAPHVKTLKLLTADITKPDGFDAADALELGWDEAQTKQWAKPLVTPYAEPTEPILEPEVVIWDSEPPALSDMPEPPMPNPDETPEMQPGPQRESIKAQARDLGLACQTNGMPHCNLANIVAVFQRVPEFKSMLWYDSFHKKIFTTLNRDSSTPMSTYREWGDEDTVAIRLLLQDQFGLTKIAISDCTDAVIYHARQNTRNEPRDWLQTLSWDGISRCEEFLTRALSAEPSEYTMAVSKNFWVAMVARILQPGCKVDNMLILEGMQGMFKSTAMSIIGGPYYAETIEHPGSKDFVLGIQGKFLVEIGELDSFKRAEDTMIKQLLSRAIDRMRPPYGKMHVDYKRQCIFVGTTNENEYLRDSTGARRFWPVKTGSIDLEYIRECREQLFAEAVHLFKIGTTWWEVPQAAAAEIAEERRQTDAWEDTIANYLVGKSEVTVLEVCDNAIKMDVHLRQNWTFVRISKILRLLGWTRQPRSRLNGGLVRRWTRDPLLIT